MPVLQVVSITKENIIIGKSTDIRIAVIRPAHRSGDQLGPCEICHKPAHNQFFANRNTIYRTGEGVAYLSAPSGGSYGHRDCLDVAYGYPHDSDNWPRLRNLRVVPNAVLEAIAAK